MRDLNMGKKVLMIFMMCNFIVCVANVLYAQETTVGGHIKLTLYDYKDGKSNGDKGHEYAGMDFREMIIYVSSELSDRVSIDIQPYFDASTGATPRIGSDLGNTKNPGDPKFKGWRKAVIKVILPYEYELAVGIVKPRFTWEYGAELFWEEEYNGGKFAINRYLGYLGSMHESGIEIYKPFEVGYVSLPAYLYVLNGGDGTADNNNVPLIMLHAEPEIGALRFLGSLATGSYDDAGKYNMIRYAVGVAYEWNNFSVRAELAEGKWEKHIGGTKDAVPFGWYTKVFYRFASWGRAMIHYDYVDHNFNGFDAPFGKLNEKYITITPGLQLSVASSSAIQIQYDIADWKRDGDSKKGISSQRLKFNRLTVGWRTTF